MVKEMRLKGISTIEEANQLLKEVYIPRYNAQFGVKAQSEINMHQPLSKTEKNQLDAIFSRHYHRVVNNDFTISFKNTWYQLVKDQPVTICKKDTVLVEERLDSSIFIRLRGKYLNYKIIPKRPLKINNTQFVLAATASSVLREQRYRQPPPNHPWPRFSLNNNKTYA